MSKAIYNGMDTRRNLYEMKEQGIDIGTFKEQAKSVACLVEKSSLIKKNGYLCAYEFATPIKTLGNEYNLNMQARFRNEPSPGFGTAYYIGNEYYMLTAGHCVCDTTTGQLDHAQVKATRIVFGFLTTSKDTYKTQFKKDEVYKIEKVVDYQCSATGADWALFKLKTKVQGRIPLDISFSKLKMNTPVYILGHPCGIPLKYAGDAKLLKKKDPNWFECDLDAFGGNSGSPVFDANTNKVIGILIRGNEDFDTSWTGRRSYHHVTPNEINVNGYEKCQRLSTLESTLTTYVPPRPSTNNTTSSYTSIPSYSPSYSTTTFSPSPSYRPRADQDFNWGLCCCLTFTAVVCALNLGR